MEQALIIHLDNEAVRFTHDGKVSVLDAIRALCNSSCQGAIWDNLKREHHENLIHCEDYYFLREGSIPVVESEGLGKVWMLLLDYLLDPDIAGLMRQEV